MHGSFSLKAAERKKKCQNPFPALLRRKKVPTATNPKGGGLS